MSKFNCSTDFYLFEVENTLLRRCIYTQRDWMENFPPVSGIWQICSFAKNGVDCNIRGVISNMFASIVVQLFPHTYLAEFRSLCWQLV